jgi:hypothetical protein
MLSEPNILIVIAVIIAAGHYLIFRLAFDQEFEDRFTIYQEQAKQNLLNDNQEFVSTMKGIIELDPEAVEKVGYGDQWKNRLDIIGEMKAEKAKIEGKIYLVYIILILSVLVSSLAFVMPDGIILPFGYNFYFTSVSWWLLVLAILLILYLLLQQYLLERRVSGTKYLEKMEGGQRISSGENAISRFLRKIESLV